MKCLSVKQPYISWIQEESKTLELRSWKTSYRGPILLCSSKVPEKFYKKEDFKYLGFALCIVELVDIFPFEPRHAKAAHNLWQDGLFAWQIKLLENITPFEVKGKLGLFNLPDELM